MSVKDIIMMASQVSIGAIVTFLAILLWSHTREVEWMLIIMGVVIKYVEILIDIFTLLGVVKAEIYLIPNMVDIELILKILPPLFYGAAFIVHLVRIKNGVE